MGASRGMAARPSYIRPLYGGRCGAGASVDRRPGGLPCKAVLPYSGRYRLYLFGPFRNVDLSLLYKIPIGRDHQAHGVLKDPHAVGRRGGLTFALCHLCSGRRVPPLRLSACPRAAGQQAAVQNRSSGKFRRQLTPFIYQWPGACAPGLIYLKSL